MTGHDDSRELFDAIVRRHEGTIKKIGALFYMPGSYHYDELVCDLTTYLWLVFYNLPRGTVISHEHAWVYSILYRKALNIIPSTSLPTSPTMPPPTTRRTYTASYTNLSAILMTTTKNSS